MSVPKKLWAFAGGMHTGTHRGAHTMEAHRAVHPGAQMGTGNGTHSHNCRENRHM